MADVEQASVDEGGGSIGPGISVMSLSDIPEELKPLEGDPYSEDETELRALLSKPTCFIVIGKPGSGKTMLAQKLAMTWKAQLVNPTDIINQNIELQTEMGIKCQEILLRGEAIPEEMVAKMVQDKINSSEVTHHGYVLDGFPCMDESYMNIPEQLELVKNWKLKPDFIVNLKIPDKDLEKRRLGQRGDEGPPELDPEILARLVKRVEDLPEYITHNIQEYKDNMLRTLEDYMADHDQQYLIELDANSNHRLLFTQLMTKLDTFILRRAAVPIRLHDQEEEELPEDMETEELLRTLASKETVAPRFRWRRSRWLRVCPVAMSEGNLVQGKPEFAVSFLDKIYVLSSPEAMEKFLKNPRPYLLPPLPRPPCKLVVTGPPTSGKTSICHLLAQKYNAVVLSMQELIKPRIEMEKEKMIQKVREETLESSINLVKMRLEQEALEKEETVSEKGDVAETDEPTEDAAKDSEGEGGEEGEEGTAEKAAEDQEEKPDEGEKEEGEKDQEGEGDQAAEEPAEETTGEGGDESKPEPPKAPEPIVVDANHPEVLKMVEDAVKEAEKQTITIPPDVYVEVMEEKIKEVENNLRTKNPEGPFFGGWILDNFPNNRDQWAAMVDKNICPDDVICLRDSSENGAYLLKRWYKVNQEEVDEKVRARKVEEAAAEAKAAEEAR
ncbi:adenylate kinase [Branchiostoma belcheri]|nr:adenylate kinase [Branchiostoma belcheri]